MARIKLANNSPLRGATYLLPPALFEAGLAAGLIRYTDEGHFWGRERVTPDNFA